MSETVTQPQQEPVSEMKATASQELFNRDVSMTEAAGMTGKNRGQISKDTNAGKLPYFLNEQGHRRYRVSDLYQVYGFQQPKQPLEKKPLPSVEQPVSNGIETAVKMARMEERLKALEDENRSLREDKAKLWEQTQQLTGRLLAAPTPATESIMPAAAPPAPKSFWQRITGQ